uniref:Uncharacterized protein n=1 Tax=Oryza rufipogon TaxID=4529 RepID=A0A0E0N5U7_ORYRU
MLQIRTSGGVDKLGLLLLNRMGHLHVVVVSPPLPLSLGAGIVSAVIVIVGAASIPDTPNSFTLRGRLNEARDLLWRICRAGAATADVDAELKDIVRVAEEDRRAWAAVWRHPAGAEAVPAVEESTMARPALGEMGSASVLRTSRRQGC